MLTAKHVEPLVLSDDMPPQWRNATAPVPLPVPAPPAAVAATPALGTAAEAPATVEIFDELSFVKEKPRVEHDDYCAYVSDPNVGAHHAHVVPCLSHFKTTRGTGRSGGRSAADDEAHYTVLERSSSSAGGNGGDGVTIRTDCQCGCGGTGCMRFGQGRQTGSSYIRFRLRSTDGAPLAPEDVVGVRVEMGSLRKESGAEYKGGAIAFVSAGAGAGVGAGADASTIVNDGANLLRKLAAAGGVDVDFRLSELSSHRAGGLFRVVVEVRRGGRQGEKQVLKSRHQIYVESALPEQMKRKRSRCDAAKSTAAAAAAAAALLTKAP
jgi:hypothetical protein